MAGCSGYDIGDILVFSNTNSPLVPIKHYAVYVGYGELVHYNPQQAHTGNSISRKSTSVIKQEKISDYLRRCHPATTVSKEVVKGFVRYGSRNLVKARAVSSVGNMQYNLVFQNCEHFAKWCVYGQKMSVQIERLLLFIAWSVATVILAGFLFFLQDPFTIANTRYGNFGAIVYSVCILAYGALGGAIIIKALRDYNRRVQYKKILNICTKRVFQHNEHDLIPCYSFTTEQLQTEQSTNLCSWLCVSFGILAILIMNCFKDYLYLGFTESHWY